MYTMPTTAKNPSAIIISPPHPLVMKLYQQLNQKKLFTAFLQGDDHAHVSTILLNDALKLDTLLYILDARPLSLSTTKELKQDEIKLLKRAAEHGVKHVLLGHQQLVSWGSHQAASKLLKAQQSLESEVASLAQEVNLNSRIIHLNYLLSSQLNHPLTPLASLYHELKDGRIIVPEPVEQLVSPLGVEDGADQILRLLFSKDSQHKIYELTGQNAIPLLNIALRLQQKLPQELEIVNQPVTLHQAAEADQVIRPKRAKTWEDLIQLPKAATEEPEKPRSPEVEPPQPHIDAPTPPEKLRAPSPPQTLTAPPPSLPPQEELEQVISTESETAELKPGEDQNPSFFSPHAPLLDEPVQKTSLQSVAVTLQDKPTPVSSRAQSPPSPEEGVRVAPPVTPASTSPPPPPGKDTLLPSFLSEINSVLPQKKEEKAAGNAQKKSVVRSKERIPKKLRVLGLGLLAITSLSVFIAGIFATPYALLYLTAQTIEGLDSSVTVEKNQQLKGRLNQRYRLAVSTNRQIQPFLAQAAPSLETYLTSLVDQVYFQSQIQLTRLEYDRQVQHLIKQVLNQESGDLYQTAQDALSVASLLYQQQATLLAHEYLQPEKKEELRQEQVKLQASRSLLGVFPELIPSSQKATYLVLLQNDLELRPTGGFISAVATLTFDQGKFIDINTQDVYQLDSQLNGRVDPPPEVQEFLGETSWYLRDANWDPDFTATAKTAEWFYEKQTGRQVAGTLALNLQTLSKLLDVVGEVKISSGETVTSKNLFDQAQYYQDVDFSQNVEKQELLSQLARGVVEKLLEGDEVKQQAILNTLLEGLVENQLLLSVHNEKAQKTLSDLTFTGELIQPVCPPTLNATSCTTDYLHLNEANVGINKANYFISRTHDHTVSLVGERPVHTHQLKLTNTAQSDAWPAGTYKTLIRFYTPSNSQPLTLRVNDQPLGLSEVTTNVAHGKTVFSFYTEVPIQSTKDISFTYETDKRLNEDSLTAYTFLVQKQPGTGADPFTLHLKHAPSTTPITVSEEAATTEDAITFSSDLGRNRFYAVELMR